MCIPLPGPTLPLVLQDPTGLGSGCLLDPSSGCPAALKCKRTQVSGPSSELCLAMGCSWGTEGPGELHGLGKAISPGVARSACEWPSPEHSRASGLLSACQHLH